MKRAIPQCHGRFLTRRQMLGHGLIAGSALALPWAFNLVRSKTARADTPTRIPFLAIDLAGGANIAGSNVMVGKKGGQLDFLTTYSYLGLPDDMHPSKPGQIDTSMGLAFHADSAFLRGIKSVAKDSTLANVDGFIVPGFSLDDSNDNQQNPCHWIYSSGRRGSLVHLIGTSGNVTGGGGKVPPASQVG